MQSNRICRIYSPRTLILIEFLLLVEGTVIPINSLEVADLVGPRCADKLRMRSLYSTVDCFIGHGAPNSLYSHTPYGTCDRSCRSRWLKKQQPPATGSTLLVQPFPCLFPCLFFHPSFPQ